LISPSVRSRHAKRMDKQNRSDIPLLTGDPSPFDLYSILNRIDLKWRLKEVAAVSK
jgi:hypothetical protein